MIRATRHTEHLAQRPGWDCRACGNPWPCANAKNDLYAEFVEYPSILIIYMSAQMCEALDDLTAHGIAPPPDVYDRFVAWIRSIHPSHYVPYHRDQPNDGNSLG